MKDLRAGWAEIGLRAFADATGLTRSGDAEDRELVVRDFLTDLRHYCWRHNLDFEELVQDATQIAKEERQEEDGDLSFGRYDES